MVIVTAPVAPETLMPSPARLEVTPELVMASGPPKICRVELSSEMPVPAVTMPVVDATTKPLESVESAAFLVLARYAAPEIESAVLDAYAIWEVEDACRPDLNQSAVVVEWESARKLRSEVYGQEKVLRLSVPPSESEPPPVNPPAVLMVTEELASCAFGRAVVRESELSVVVPVI